MESDSYAEAGRGPLSSLLAGTSQEEHGFAVVSAFERCQGLVLDVLQVADFTEPSARGQLSGGMGGSAARKRVNGYFLETRLLLGTGAGSVADCPECGREGVQGLFGRNTCRPEILARFGAAWRPPAPVGPAAAKLMQL